jgi:hypothetical protein
MLQNSREFNSRNKVQNICSSSSSRVELVDILGSDISRHIQSLAVDMYLKNKDFRLKNWKH